MVSNCNNYIQSEVFYLNDFLNIFVVRSQQGNSYTASDSVNFVVNGNSSTRGRWPWQVSLQKTNGYFWYHTCGATLIHQQFIMTAAHCTGG